MPRAAALYLRSSKDRSDVSIAAQRRALLELAATKEMHVVAEYQDAVESGKDDQRPGYQRMLCDLSSRGRAWSVLLAYDTSRIARRRHIAQALAHEAKKYGVSILYATVPEVDPISTVLLESTLQAIDEVHSLMSREKGLAGMAENVRRGFRAGGRAPFGYALERVTTAVIRDGQPVMKSRLVPSPDAHAVARYLRGRAAGNHGSALAKELRIPLSRSALVDVEWNALTYAGHTVWNMRRAKDSQGQGSRRPRAEWMIQRSTHEALITDPEAEALLQRLESVGAARLRRRGAGYLLSGLLVRPDGVAWHGHSGHYDTRGGFVNAAELERAVLEQVAADFSTPAMVAAFTREARRLQEELTDRHEIDAAKIALADIEGRTRKLTALLERMDDPSPLLRRLEELEIERRPAAERVLRAEAEQDRVRVLESVTERDVAQLLAGLAEDIAALDRETLKDVLRAWIGKIELDPATRAGRLIYRLTLNPVSVASPRGADAIRVRLQAAGAPFWMPRQRPPRALSRTND